MNSLSDILNTNMSDFQQKVTNNQGLVTNDAPEQSSEHRQHIDTQQLKQLIFSIKDQLDGMLRLLDGKHEATVRVVEDTVETIAGEKIIEGVFTGEKMLGADGREYSVPPNYASKSKLVEGDMMKLTITNTGSFLYKQIGPIERKRIVGKLVCDPDTSQWSVLSEGRSYKVLNASVSFFKGSAGDEVVILVPESGESQWGAVENVIHG